MTPTAEVATLPDFEIDHPETFAQFILSNPREVMFYLNSLARQRSLFTAYINEGALFFLTAIIAVDEAAELIFLDPEQEPKASTVATTARQITLVANLNNIKIQIRLGALKKNHYQGREALSVSIPETMLRLQRREFFRLEPPASKPISCKLVTPGGAGPAQVQELRLVDISGGGVCLVGPTTIVEHFPRNAMFQQCRLEIPGEGVIQVNLRVRKTVEMSEENGRHSLRIGCEFVNLVGARLALIERYITRIERERKARDSGLAD